MTQEACGPPFLLAAANDFWGAMINFSQIQKIDAGSLEIIATHSDFVRYNRCRCYRIYAH